MIASSKRQNKRTSFEGVIGERLMRAFLAVHQNATGRDHCPALGISNDMPESGGGGVTDGVEVAASDDDDGGDDDGEPARRKELRNRFETGNADTSTSLTNKRRDGAVNKMTTSHITETSANSNDTDGSQVTSLTFVPALFAFSYLSLYTSFGRSRIYQLIADPVLKFPSPIKIGKSSRWLKTEVDSWLAKQADSRHQVAG